eukprot:2558058-Amphidinium_carterae.1
MDETSNKTGRWHILIERQSKSQKIEKYIALVTFRSCVRLPKYCANVYPDEVQEAFESQHVLGIAASTRTHHMSMAAEFKNAILPMTMQPP